MEDRWIVYCHIHIDSGRRYVGLTKKTMERRWERHVQDASQNRGRGCSHFWAAIRKYGPSAFSHEVLEVCDTLEAANAAEERWIDKLGTLDPEKGFNLIRGGGSQPHPVRNPWDRPDYREANAGRNVRHILTSEARERQKASLRSPESRAKRSALAKESLARPETVERRRLMREDPSYAASISSSLKKSLADPSVRAAMSSRTAALRQDPDYREKLASAHSAAMASPDVRAKFSASSRAAWSDPSKTIGMTGRHLSDETKARIGAKSLGRRHTPESVERQRHLYLLRSSLCRFCASVIDGKRSCIRGRVCCLLCRSMQDLGLASFLRPDGSLILV